MSVEDEMGTGNDKCKRLILEWEFDSILNPVFNIGSVGKESMKVESRVV